MTMRNLRVPVALVAGLVLMVAVPLVALPTFQESRTPSRTDRDIQGLMDAYVISKMQEALELDDEQFARMVVAQKKVQQRRRDFQRERRENLKELQRLVRTADSKDQEIAALVEKLDSQRVDFVAATREDYRAIDEILSVRQRGRYRLLEVMLERRLQELMQDVRGRAQNPDRRPPNR